MITVSLDSTTAMYLFALVTGTDDEYAAMEAAESHYGSRAVSADKDDFYDGYVVRLEREGFGQW